jgi:cell division protein ZapA (FtsZ GTPase activity inhibitor)
MSWIKWLLLDDLSQQLNLSEQQDALAGLERELERYLGCLDRDIKTLQKENYNLKILVIALIRVMADKGITTKGEIEEIIATIEREKKQKTEESP